MLTTYNKLNICYIFSSAVFWYTLLCWYQMLSPSFWLPNILTFYVSWCWENSINGKSINRLLMHAERAHYGMCRKKCFISYVHISHVNSLASIDTPVWTLKTFPGILSFEYQYIEVIAEISSRVLWHFMTQSYYCKEHPSMGKYSLVENRMVIPYDTIEGQYVVTGNISCLSLFFFLSI